MEPTSRLTDDELLRELRRAVQSLPDAPEPLLRAALALMAAAPPLADRAALLVHRWLAELSFDSWSTPALATGMRSLRSPVRHLVYSAGEHDIELRVSGDAAGVSVVGQVLGPEAAGHIEAATEGGVALATHRAPLDALGMFRLEGLAPGAYVLSLRLGDAEIVLPAFAVEEPDR